MFRSRYSNVAGSALRRFRRANNVFDKIEVEIENLIPVLVVKYESKPSNAQFIENCEAE